jgi:hypothetical protein
MKLLILIKTTTISRMLISAAIKAAKKKYPAD